MEDNQCLYLFGVGTSSSLLLLLLLLSRFSCVRLCATPQTTAHQALPSLGFSRQEHWSGLPLPSLLCESEVVQSRPTCSDPMDCSLPGSSVHGFFQARVLEWLAFAFSESVAQDSIDVKQKQEFWLLPAINNSFTRPGK